MIDETSRICRINLTLTENLLLIIQVEFQIQKMKIICRNDIYDKGNPAQETVRQASIHRLSRPFRDGWETWVIATKTSSRVSGFFALNVTWLSSIYLRLLFCQMLQKCSKTLNPFAGAQTTLLACWHTSLAHSHMKGHSNIFVWTVVIALRLISFLLDESVVYFIIKHVIGPSVYYL